MNDQFRYPDSAVFYRKLTRRYPLIVRGEGCWLIDDADKRYLDASRRRLRGQPGPRRGRDRRGAGGAGAEDRLRQRHCLSPTSPSRHWPPSSRPSRRATSTRSTSSCSGSEAVEAALKLARQYWVETRHARQAQDHRASRPAITATRCSRSRPRRASTTRRSSAPWLVDVDARCRRRTRYRCECGGRRSRLSDLHGDRARGGDPAARARRTSPRSSPSRSAAPPPARRCRAPDYFKRVREICDRHQVLFIADEVLTGAGRTGTWSRDRARTASPDIMTLGKGITGGYAPLSAVVAPRADPGRAREGLRRAACTRRPSRIIAVLCAAGLATVRYLQRAWPGRALRGDGSGAAPASCSRCCALPHVGDVRGRGLLAGVEFVAGQGQRASRSRARAKFAETFVECALRRGPRGLAQRRPRRRRATAIS